MTDSKELTGRLGGDVERILNAVSGNAGKYKLTVIRENVVQDCEQCGHRFLGVIRANAEGGDGRYYYVGYCQKCYHVQLIKKGPFMTRFD